MTFTVYIHKSPHPTLSLWERVRERAFMNPHAEKIRLVCDNLTALPINFFPKVENLVKTGNLGHAYFFQSKV